MKWRVLSCLVFSLLVSSPSAYADIVLDFEGITDSNISQSYGDSPYLNVSYRELEGFGNATVVYDSLGFWAVGYGDLENVAWGSDLIVERVAEIRFDSLTAHELTLNSFDAADWDGSANAQAFRVYDGNYDLLFEVTNYDVDNVTHSTIMPNVSSETLILQWDYPWAVAVDNISIQSVPEPSAICVLFAGAGILILKRATNRIRTRLAA